MNNETVASVSGAAAMLNDVKNQMVARTPQRLDRMLMFYPEPLLKERAAPWLASIKGHPGIQDLLDDMAFTMTSLRAEGLAAVQVGVPYRVAVLQGHNGVIHLINPSIVKRSAEVTFKKEGCLSFPGVFECVQRAEQVEISAMNRNGEPITLVVNDGLARAAQHEIDHLNGILFTERMSKYKREAAMKKLRLVKTRILHMN